MVRVGLTQFPAGVGVKEPADLKPDLVDACQNLRKHGDVCQGHRIVAKWLAIPSKDVLQQIFEDAVYAWKTGEFEGVACFRMTPDGALSHPKRNGGPLNRR
uniref:hypothetical protein n=1 Tax=Rhizobium sp. F40D2 TaxID=3453141 RepID=UPI003F1EB129